MHLRFIVATCTAILLLFPSCKKETTEILRENVVVEGNQPPQHQAVATITIENYITKVYIDLIGLEPTATELDQQVQYLKDNDLSEAARESIITDLQDQRAYYQQFWNRTAADLLDGVTDPEIQNEINTFLFIIQQSYINGDTLVAYAFEQEVDRLSKVLSATTDWQQGNIDIREFYQRFTLNYFYDQINMGSENFVIACFENLLGRLPTATELDNGVTMVDGFPSQILRVDGNDKIEFSQIMVNSTEFFERLVINTYAQLLNRAPSAPELSLGVLAITSNYDVKSLQSDLLKSPAYAGF